MVQKLSTQGPQNRVIAAVPLAIPGREVGRPSSGTPRLRSELPGAGNKYGQEYARPFAQSAQDPLAKFRPFLDLREAGGKEAFEGSLAALVKGTPSPVPAPVLESALETLDKGQFHSLMMALRSSGVKAFPEGYSLKDKSTPALKSEFFSALSGSRRDQGRLSSEQIFGTTRQCTTPEEIVKIQDKYPLIAESYASVTAKEFFDSPAAKNLSFEQKSAAAAAFQELTRDVAQHFSPAGLKAVEGEDVKAAALFQHANYVAGEMCRAYPDSKSLTHELVRNAVIEHFDSGHDVKALAAKLSEAGGPGLDYFKGNGWMVGDSFNAETGKWGQHYGFGDLDVALNLPGVYGGQATLAFADALAPGKGQDLLRSALEKNFWERTPNEAAVVEFCMRSSQAGWVVSKLGRGIVEANNPKKAAGAPKHFAHHDLMTFNQLKERKGWSEMVKDLDQTRAFALRMDIIAPAQGEPKPIEESMLHVLSRGVFEKGADGTLSLNPHAQALRAYLKDQAAKAAVKPEFIDRSSQHVGASALTAAGQAAHSVRMDGALFPGLLKLFMDAGTAANGEMMGGKGASVAGIHAFNGFQSFSESAASLIGQAEPSDILKLVGRDLKFSPIEMDGKQLKKNWEELLELKVIEGYGSERVNGDPEKNIAPASTRTGTLADAKLGELGVGLRFAQLTWLSTQVEVYLADLAKKGKSDRLERSAFDLFDAHKLGTYNTALGLLQEKGVSEPRRHELAISVVAFEVYKDLFNLEKGVQQDGESKKS